MGKRFGFTTGSCAAAASKAACYMLLSGLEKSNISIVTPSGTSFEAEIVNIIFGENYVKCAVVKDGGEDPDVTTGAHITATVSYLQDKDIIIDGGEGVGRVTLPGLDQKIGEAAINHVPRQMIYDGIKEVCSIFDYEGGIKVEISVPEGNELAKKTFNPKLGIENGISILGTSGIVEPMSLKAVLDTIKVELNQKREMGFESIVVSPGNYGLDFMKKTFGYDLDRAVKCSNFIGDTIDMAKEMGFKSMLLVGHIGKLIKLSGGIMNTHSKVADSRMELMSIAALKAGAARDVMFEILKCATTQEAIDLLNSHNLLEATMSNILDDCMNHLNKRADGMHMELMIYSNENGVLAKSEKAMEYLM